MCECGLRAGTIYLPLAKPELDLLLFGENTFNMHYVHKQFDIKCAYVRAQLSEIALVLNRNIAG